MANNHMGSVSHAKKIIDKFAHIVHKHNLNAAIKLQFRQLDSFIHQDFIQSDLKYVKRFKETKLSKTQFKEIIDYIRENELQTCCTAFDNESIPWLEELDIGIIKVASCSVDDWLLLEELSKINKKIIISTAGASLTTLHKVHDLFKDNKRDFTFMHCVADYPTPSYKANLNRITILKNEFPDIEIGYSTHEKPEDTTAEYAIAMGCNIIEKHIGVPTSDYALNQYSLSPQDFEEFLNRVAYFQDALLGKSDTQHMSLRSLKRGLYFNKDLKDGSVIQKEDLYSCIPVQDMNSDYHFDASDIYDIVGQITTDSVNRHSAVTKSIVSNNNDFLASIKNQIIALLDEANVEHQDQEVELSCHYGLENFKKAGCAIITKVNRAYCKKLIVCLPGQSHPSHRHLQKEECFELLHGDCTVKLNYEEIELVKGQPLLVNIGVNHSFKSVDGCVLEEISSRHIRGDSIYSDMNINKLSLTQRKIITRL